MRCWRFAYGSLRDSINSLHDPTTWFSDEEVSNPAGLQDQQRYQGTSGIKDKSGIWHVSASAEPATKQLRSGINSCMLLVQRPVLCLAVECDTVHAQACFGQCFRL